MAKKSALGKGFAALLPTDFDDNLLANAGDKIEHVAINRLVPNRYQPRTEFDTSALEQLAESIKSYGVLQPLVVTSDREGSGYMIIAGERRWRASKLAGQETVPVIVRTAEDLAQLEIALIENVQRVNLSPLEEAASIEYLHTQFGTTYEMIAKRLGKGTSTVMNIIRLLNLPDEATQALRDGRISEGHARAILALRKVPQAEEQQAKLLENILQKDWTVRQAEQFVATAKEGAPQATAETSVRRRMETPATKSLSKRLNTSVYIRRTAKGGKIEVNFSSDEELNTILKSLND
jgi:ParB family chromosome partitioning protein